MSNQAMTMPLLTISIRAQVPTGELSRIFLRSSSLKSFIVFLPERGCRLRNNNRRKCMSLLDVIKRALLRRLRGWRSCITRLQINTASFRCTVSSFLLMTIPCYCWGNHSPSCRHAKTKFNVFEWLEWALLSITLIDYPGEEGILAGISSGAALAAAMRYARLESYVGKTILVILPDSGGVIWVLNYSLS